MNIPFVQLDADKLTDAAHVNQSSQTDIKTKKKKNTYKNNVDTHHFMHCIMQIPKCLDIRRLFTVSHKIRIYFYHRVREKTIILDLLMFCMESSENLIILRLSAAKRKKPPHQIAVTNNKRRILSYSVFILHFIFHCSLLLLFLWLIH